MTLVINNIKLLIKQTGLHKQTANASSVPLSLLIISINNQNESVSIVITCSDISVRQSSSVYLGSDWCLGRKWRTLQSLKWSLGLNLPDFKYRFRGQMQQYASVSDCEEQWGSFVTPFVRMSDGSNERLYVEERVQVCIWKDSEHNFTFRNGHISRISLFIVIYCRRKDNFCSNMHNKVQIILGFN